MGLKTREEIKEEYKWDIGAMYKTDADWEADFSKVKEGAGAVAALKGTLGSSAESLHNCLKLKDELYMIAENIYVYANLKHDEDTENPTYQALSARVDSLLTEVMAQLSFIEPEILAIDKGTLGGYINNYEPLKPYKHYIEGILRLKEHTLSDEMETVLAKVSEIGQAASKIFTMLNNADLKFGTIKDENGKDKEVTHGSYLSLMESKSRDVRKAAFEALYKAYIAHKNTLAESYAASVRNAVFFAKERKYKSCLDASLFGNNIPTEVYHNLIKTVHAHLPSLHKYMEVRKRALKIDTLHIYDIYVPLVPEIDTNIDYDKAKDMVIKSLAPLGDEYVSELKAGFDARWVDIYENKGKKSGAYSWGSYKSHPYILLNYDNKVNDMFTLTHEIGHSMHSHLTRKNQAFVYGDYTLFVAEVSSTVNEALLMEYLLNTEKDGNMKKYLINYYMEQFRATLFRQTMFAEFELKTHEMVEAGEALTSQELNKIYRELNEKYFGKSVALDEQIDYEWSRIPHFYRPFYVYQYATGHSAAIALSRKILDGNTDGYLKFLKSGSSMYPIDQLKMAGVDMGNPEAVDLALNVFDELVDKFEKM
ncbi:MAG: oligoendopeptidase F [Defluviitaleaceae bacterium]|nr:oligoendopeptidase F [Defluviitaleaceae bacterium]